MEFAPINTEFLDFPRSKAPGEILKPYLAALREKPSADSDFEIKQNYYFTLPLNKPEQFKWFCDALLEETVRRARAESGPIPEITDLVVVYSGAVVASHSPKYREGEVLDFTPPKR